MYGDTVRAAQLCAVAASTIAFLTACSGSSAPSAPANSGMVRSVAPRFASGIPSKRPNAQPSVAPPGTLAFEAQVSIQPVAVLHAAAVRGATAAGLRIARVQANETARQFDALADGLPGGAHRLQLQMVLRRYAVIAVEVARGADVRQPLSEADRTWRVLLDQLGAEVHIDLNRNIPPLVLPKR